jgi:hypothetical protein
MSAVLPSDTIPRGGRGDRGDLGIPQGSARLLDDLITGVPGLGPRPLVTLVWDDGVRHVVRGPSLVGRNPQPVPGWRAIAVRDETLSLSRAHFALGGTPGAAWVADTGSSNGTEIVRDGVSGGTERHRIAIGERWMLRAGDILEVGDRRVTIEGV